MKNKKEILLVALTLILLNAVQTAQWQSSDLEGGTFDGNPGASDKNYDYILPSSVTNMYHIKVNVTVSNLANNNAPAITLHVMTNDGTNDLHQIGSTQTVSSLGTYNFESSSTQVLNDLTPGATNYIHVIAENVDAGGTCGTDDDIRWNYVRVTISYSIAPTVESPKTYESGTTQEKTLYYVGEGVRIRVNVSDDEGSSDLDTVHITIINPQDNVKVNNASMSSIGSITNGFTYEYNYTIPVESDSVGGWTINVYANDSMNILGYNTSSFNAKPKILADNTSYIVDETVQIIGYGWSGNSDVSLALMEPDSDYVSGYPKNVSTDAAGNLTNTWMIPLNAEGGSYKLFAFDPADPGINDTIYFNVTALSIETNKLDYVRTETVHITGGGFASNVNVTVVIYNPTMDNVSGYPLNVFSNSTGQINDSWLIPGGQALGTYTVNATDTTNSNRSASTTFEIVSAIIQVDKPSYEQGENVNISGYNWDNNVDVTLNITGPGGLLVYGPINVSSNGSGWINDSWFVDYNQTLGSYTINAIEPSNPSKNDDYVFTITQRPVSLSTEYGWYKQQDTVNISGAGFSPTSNVTVYIYNSSGQSVLGYPKNVPSNSSGGINDSWSIPANQKPDNITINASDTVYSNLKNSTVIEIVVQKISTDSSSYSSGETVYISGRYWDRLSNVNLNLRNSTGQSVAGYPKNASTNSTGGLTDTWTAQPGAGFGAETYNLTAKQATDYSVNDSTSFDVTKVATLQTDKPEYDQNEIVNITGSYYTPGQDVKLWIKCLDNNGMALGYPKTIKADANGDIGHLWNTTDICKGNYSIESQDQTYPALLHANTTFDVTFTYVPVKNSSTGQFTGTYGGSGGTYQNTWINDTTYWYFGNDALFGGDITGYAQLTYDITSLGVSESDITNLGFTLVYCHSGDANPPNCNGNAPIEGTRQGDQNVEAYNYGTGQWIDIGNLRTNDGENEVTDSWDATGTPGDYIDNTTNEIMVRYELDYNNGFNQDSWLVLDYAILKVTYKLDKNCTPFDVIPPAVVNVMVEPDPQKLGKSVNITVNVTDANNVGYVKAIVDTPNGQLNLTMTDPDSDNVYNCTFTSTTKTGVYNISIWANDSWGNVNNTLGGNFTIEYDTLAVKTNKPSYIRLETVYITGAGFNANVNVSIDINNISGQSVSSYPMNVVSNSTGGVNASWLIPGGQALGTYTVNATDVTFPKRSAEITFDIVTAIVQSDKLSYEQGEVVYVSGYNWNYDVDVTLNITGPGGLVYGPINVSSNGSGCINDSWFTDYNRTLGNYTIYAFEPLTPAKNDDYAFEITPKSVSLSTEYGWYKQQDTVNISGAGFSPTSNVTVYIYNSIGQSVLGYPKNVLSNSSGQINDTWTIPSGQALGVYTINASDYSYPNLFNATSIQVVVQQIQTDKSAYKSGETVYITGLYWDRLTKVILDVKNSTGQSALGYPRNVSTLADGTLSDSWTALPGAGFGAETYNLTAKQAADYSMNDASTFDVTKVATLKADKSEYDQGGVVNITGSFYAPGGDVELRIINTDTGGVVHLYPKIIQSDSQGDIEHLWNNMDICEGNYSIKAVDQTYPDQLYANNTFIALFYDDNISTELADSGALTGGYNMNGGSYTDTYSSNSVFHYLGAYNTETTFQAWVNYSFSLTELNLELDRLQGMNFTLNYCHSGNQLTPKCGEGYRHEGETNGDQDVELWNYSSSSWVDVGNIAVNDTNDTKHTGSWLIDSGFTDFISGDVLYIRFEASFNQSGSDDDVLLIDYLDLDVSYQTHVSRSCTGFPTTYINLTNYNGSYTVDYGINVSIMNSSGQVIDSDTGIYYKYLYNGTYDLQIKRQTNNGTLSAVIRNISLTSSINTLSQVTEYYLGETPFGNVSDLTTLFALNDEYLDYDKAELTIPRRGLNISFIIHCLSWDYVKANCSNWGVNDTSDYGMQENSTHIWFNVTGFDSFGGGKGKPLPNITQIRVYDVDGLSNTHSGGALVDSGLNTTFILYKREPRLYRVELDVRNDGKTQWTIDSTDLVYHEGLNTSWIIDTANDIWYYEGDTNYTGGNYSNGRITWNTSQGGKLTNGEQGTFYYVVNITSSGNQKYLVHFLANDTVNNAGSFDYSVYNITRAGYLEITLVTPPVIPGQGNASQNGGYKVGQNKTFIVNATVYCRDGVCGGVNATLRYNKSSVQPDTAVNTSSDTPFYVLVSDNPQDCPNNPLGEDEYCNVTWTVNSTGALNKLWVLDVLFNSTYAQGNDTGDIYIEITKVLIMSLSWGSIDFGFCDPGSNANNATLNIVDGYNITVDNNSNKIDGILVKGTDLSADTVGGFNGITYDIGVGNISLNDDINDFNHINTTRLTHSYAIMREDIYPGTEFHNYYWLDVPSGRYSQHYSGTLYVLANSSTS